VVPALLIGLFAFGVSLLTLFSGFGLGTLLLPAFALVYPLDVAVAATALVHLANNIWKGGLLGKKADRATVLRFGIPAALAAFAGAALLLWLDDDPVFTYTLDGERAVTPIGLVVGGLITVFALFDLVPRLRDLAIPPRYLVAGGALSGFFGGLSGHQGALRSMFLTKLGLDATRFVATGTLCAILVDVSRLAVYSGRFAKDAETIGATGGWPLLAGAVAMAFAGAVIGKALLGKVTIEGVRALVGVLLLVVGPALALGLV